MAWPWRFRSELGGYLLRQLNPLRKACEASLPFFFDAEKRFLPPLDIDDHPLQGRIRDVIIVYYVFVMKLSLFVLGFLSLLF